MAKDRETVWVRCPKCHGSRYVSRKCGQCGGKGHIGKDKFGNEIPCSQCGMTGEIEDACGTCGGVGQVPV